MHGGAVRKVFECRDLRPGNKDARWDFSRYPISRYILYPPIAMIVRVAAEFPANYRNMLGTTGVESRC